jgi:hypothetical protein
MSVFLRQPLGRKPREKLRCLSGVNHSVHARKNAEKRAPKPPFGGVEERSVVNTTALSRAKQSPSFSCSYSHRG